MNCHSEVTIAIGILNDKSETPTRYISSFFRIPTVLLQPKHRIGCYLYINKINERLKLYTYEKDNHIFCPDGHNSDTIH